MAESITQGTDNRERKLMRIWTLALAPVVAVVALLALAPLAQATTFCVPGFGPGCQSGGGRIAQPSLYTAMLTNGDDGNADRIVIQAGTISNNATYELDSGDADDLTIVGAGRSKTRVTAAIDTNSFVMNLSGHREILIRDLTLSVPAAMPDGFGGAMQADDTTLTNVDIQVRNVGGDGVSFIGGGAYTGGRIYGSAAGGEDGAVDIGVSTNGAASGALDIERVVIDKPVWGVSAVDGNVPVFVRRTRIIEPLAYGVRVHSGGFVLVENSIIEGAATGIPVSVESTDGGTVIATVRSSTITGPDSDPGSPAIWARVLNNPGNGSINLNVRDTIIANYEDQALHCEAPTNGSIGDVGFTVAYSYLFNTATESGDCNLSVGSGVDATTAGAPVFLPSATGLLRLPAGSPAVDSGDPLPSSQPLVDFEGSPRPVDGNGNGLIQRDMGAFERQPPPKIKKLRFRRNLVGGGHLALRLSEAASVKAIFKPRGPGSDGSKVVKLRFKGSKGANKRAVPNGKLADHRYRLTVIATGRTAIKSAPARLNVPAS